MSQSEKLNPLWFLGIMAAIAIAAIMWSNRVNSILESKGVSLPAKITSSTYGRGYNITFEYIFRGKKYENIGSTDKFICNEGDSILIKILPDNPDGRFYVVSKIRNR